MFFGCFATASSIPIDCRGPSRSCPGGTASRCPPLLPIVSKSRRHFASCAFWWARLVFSSSKLTLVLPWKSSSAAHAPPKSPTSWSCQLLHADFIEPITATTSLPVAFVFVCKALRFCMIWSTLCPLTSPKCAIAPDHLVVPAASAFSASGRVLSRSVMLWCVASNCSCAFFIDSALASIDRGTSMPNRRMAPVTALNALS